MLESIRLEKVQIIVEERHVLECLQYLAERRIFHISPSLPSGGQESPLSRRRREEDRNLHERYSSLVERIDKLLDFLGGPPPEGVKARTDEEDSDAIDDEALTRGIESLEEELLRVEKECGDIEAGMELILDEKRRLRMVAAQLQPLAGTGLPLESYEKMRFVRLFIGALPRRNVQRLEKALLSYPCVIQPLAEQEERAVVMVAVDRTYERIVEKTLDSAFFSELKVPHHLNGTPADILGQIREYVAELDEELKELERERRRLREKALARLSRMRRKCARNARCFGILKELPQGAFTYTLEGWVPAREVEDMARGIHGLSARTAILNVMEGASVKEPPPTLLDNPPPFDAFEQLTTTYSVPAHDELDPTVVLALSSMLLFGMMFSDMAHAVLLMGASVLFSSSLSRKARSVIRCLAASALFFGLLSGSFMGVKAWTLSFYPQTTMGLLMTSTATGLLMILGTFLLSIRNLSVNERYRRWLFDHHGVCGLAFYVSLLTLSALAATGASPAWLSGPALILLSSSVMMTWHAAAHEGSMLMGITTLVETFLADLTNTISFVRVGAFALCHEILCETVRVLCSMVSDGGMLWWLLFMAGHVTIVVVEGFIVMIQTMRLNYYELFSRFFKGGGRLFTPLTLDA